MISFTIPQIYGNYWWSFYDEQNKPCNCGALLSTVLYIPVKALHWWNQQLSMQLTLTKLFTATFLPPASYSHLEAPTDSRNFDTLFMQMSIRGLTDRSAIEKVCGRIISGCNWKTGRGAKGASFPTLNKPLHCTYNCACFWFVLDHGYNIVCRNVSVYEGVKRSSFEVKHGTFYRSFVQRYRIFPLK